MYVVHDICNKYVLQQKTLTKINVKSMKIKENKQQITLNTTKILLNNSK